MHARVRVAISSRPDPEVYVKPTRDPTSWHVQRVALHQLEGAPPGRWFVTVRGGVAVMVAQDSGIRPDGASVGVSVDLDLP